MNKIIYSLFFILLISLQAKAITISPSITSIETEPNIPQNVSYSIYNETKQELKVNVFVWDLWFNEKSEKIYAQPSKENLKYLKTSIARYLEPEEKEFLLKPKETKKVKVLFNIPKSVIGGNTAAIFFQAEPFIPKGQNTLVAMVSRLGATVFQETKGTVITKTRITSVNIKKKKSRPLDFKMKVKNEGNSTVLSNVMVGILGQNESFYGTFEITKKLIPDTKEVLFEKEVPITLPSGNYNAVITLNYKNKSTTINKMFTVD